MIYVQSKILINSEFKTLAIKGANIRRKQIKFGLNEVSTK